ncbi:hypothetical protein VMCG_10781 [Cytospora schulzeri]|uniref:Uncharacterized protein n=1 Tax=Cytospora schulzeri TaxID=448051 RepID=A0A423V9E2_9PEZI|nr:hypothetical protein VMCG_10781 [Valsa malicola]
MDPDQVFYTVEWLTSDLACSNADIGEDQFYSLIDRLDAIAHHWMETLLRCSEDEVEEFLAAELHCLAISDKILEIAARSEQETGDSQSPGSIDLESSNEVAVSTAASAYPRGHLHDGHIEDSRSETHSQQSEGSEPNTLGDVSTIDADSIRGSLRRLIAAGDAFVEAMRDVMSLP